MSKGSNLRDQRGSALVYALLMLVVLTILGIAALTTSTVEVQISGNDKVYKRSFYAADGGSNMYSELLEQNIEDRGVWTNDTVRGDVLVHNGSFYLNSTVTTPPTNPTPVDLSSSTPAPNYDAFFPSTATAGTGPRTNLKVCGNVGLSNGAAVQLAAGYEGKGKGAGSGGAWIMYEVRAQYFDNRGGRNNQDTVHLGWKHVM
jgi:Tfp pilus assembly protein PilX